MICNLLFLRGLITQHTHEEKKAFSKVWENLCDLLLKYRRLGVRRALMLFNNLPLKIRRALLTWALYSASALLVLNWTSLNSGNALVALSWRYTLHNAFALWSTFIFYVLHVNMPFLKSQNLVKWDHFHF